MACIMRNMKSLIMAMVFMAKRLPLRVPNEMIYAPLH